MKRPTLKVEQIGGLQVIKCRKEDIAWDGGRPIAICIPDFRGQAGDPIRNVVYIEYFSGRLQIRTYDGMEDSIIQTDRSKSIGSNIYVKPDPALTHAAYCPIEELPKLLNSEDEAVVEIVEQRFKENK